LSDEKDAIHQVVSGYFDAFARDPAAAAAFYGEPTLIVLPNEVLALATRSDVEGFLAKLLESLKPLGYARTKLDAPRVKMLNATTALYSTVAIRMKTGGRVGFIARRQQPRPRVPLRYGCRQPAVAAREPLDGGHRLSGRCRA
jgi:hypothetical protein